MNNLEIEKIQSLERQVKKLENKIDQIEREKQQQFEYLKQTLDFYISKVDKYPAYVANNDGLLALSTMQENDVNDQVNQVNQEVEHHVRHHQVPQSHPGHHQIPHSNHSHFKPDEALSLEGNIHPDLQVAQAQAQAHAVVASAARAANSTNGLDDFDKAKLVKRKLSANNQQQGTPENKRPSIAIEFIHNPMTVKEIWEEFTKGFKGQPALCELDDRYGKAQWRGDSRSKESKRYQRRKRLCDAINKGMVKYNKSADEIISYIEEFRGDKSLTWVMNGNLPEDLVM